MKRSLPGRHDSSSILQHGPGTVCVLWDLYKQLSGLIRTYRVGGKRRAGVGAASSVRQACSEQAPLCRVKDFGSCAGERQWGATAGCQQDGAVLRFAFQREPPGSSLETLRLLSLLYVPSGPSPGIPRGGGHTAHHQLCAQAAVRTSAPSMRAAFGAKEELRAGLK